MKRSTAKRIRSGAKSLFLEYCSNSSVHGVRYFGCRERTGCEKFWWIVVFVLSMGSCALLINKIYRKWEQTPVIVSFAEKSTPVWQIPFPAVTICPQTKALRSMLNFSDEYDQFSNSWLSPQQNYSITDNMCAMLQLCERVFYDMFLDVTILPNKTTNESYATLMSAMSIPVYSMLNYCTIRNELRGCRRLFSASLTEEGICYTFNGLSADALLRTEVLQMDDPYLSETRPSPHWSLTHGYSKAANLSSYPFRTLGPGYSAGFTANLEVEDEDMEYLCVGPVQGFKVLLHSPADYPQVSKKFVRVPMDQEVNIAVKPQMITTTPGLRDYTPEGRQCFFNRERYLQFFRVYTQDNCELECLTNFTLLHCGCVKFSMLRTNQTAVCEINRIRCLLDAETKLLEMDIVKHQDESLNFRANCNCLPACTSVQYDAEITQTDFDWLNWARSFKVSVNETKGMHLTRLGIYYKETQFMTSKRSELYGITDFIANCGGLLGLCMGVSLLSLVELLYFCSVRPYMLWRKYKLTKAKKVSEVQGISLLSVAVKID